MFLSTGYIQKRKKAMTFQRFKEYLNDKGDIQKKPVVKADADTGPSGKSAPKPPKAQTKGKNWKNFQVKGEAAQVDDGGDGTKPAAYSAPGTDPGQQTADGDKGKADPLSQKGDKSLVYNPKTGDQSLKMKKLQDTKTETFLNKTRGLSAQGYAEYVLKQSSPNGIKQIIETVELISKNELLVEALVRELKRKGDFATLIETVLSQPETYNEIAASLASPSRGKDIARQLAKAVNEITAEPASDDIVPETPASKKMPPNKDSINSRGEPVQPEHNARRAKTVKGVPAEDGNIMQSMMRPEHTLIEALANYKSIRMAMKKLVD